MKDYKNMFDGWEPDPGYIPNNRPRPIPLPKPRNKHGVYNEKGELIGFKLIKGDNITIKINIIPFIKKYTKPLESGESGNPYEKFLRDKYPILNLYDLRSNLVCSLVLDTKNPIEIESRLLFNNIESGGKELNEGVYKMEVKLFTKTFPSTYLTIIPKNVYNLTITD